VRPVSDEFLNVIRGSHQVAIRVTVLTSFQTGVSPTGTELLVINGDVTLDATADVRGTVDVTVDGTNAFSRDPDGLLTPYGNELFVERGVVFGTGTREMVSQGYYRIYSVEQDDRPDAPIRLAGRDRMSGIVDGRLLAPMQFVAGTSIETVFETLVQEIYPTAEVIFDFDAATSLLATSHVADEDRYTFLRDLANARGKIMFWDYAGRLRVEDPPDPSVTVFDVNAGAHGVLLSLDRRIDREGVYNAVVALGEAPSTEVTPVRAVARDMNASSPTFWDGPFGKVPRFYQSPFITTGEQAATAAEKILARSIGLPYSVDFTAVPNPALEPLDPVRVTHRDGYENHVIERLRVPLTVTEPIVATTREQTAIVIEVEQ
jgi:hypothetical protein